MTFEEASTVFNDPLLFADIDDSQHSVRHIVIGMSAKSRVLLVVAIERDEDVIRIISARKATAHERQEYEGA